MTKERIAELRKRFEIIADAFVMVNCQLDVIEVFNTLEAALKDGERLDWLADDRAFDGINSYDIDDMTHGALPPDSTEEQWRLEWRKQMRAAIDAAIEADAGKGRG